MKKTRERERKRESGREREIQKIVYPVKNNKITIFQNKSV